MNNTSSSCAIKPWTAEYELGTYDCLRDVHAATGYPNLDGVDFDGGLAAWMERLPFCSRFVALSVSDEVVGHVGTSAPGITDAAQQFWATHAGSTAPLQMVTRLFVHPSLAGQGLGQLLLQQALGSVDCQRDVAAVSVEPRLLKPIRLYERCGAVLVGSYRNRANLELLLYRFPAPSAC